MVHTKLKERQTDGQTCRETEIYTRLLSNTIIKHAAHHETAIIAEYLLSFLSFIGNICFRNPFRTFSSDSVYVGDANSMLLY